VLDQRAEAVRVAEAPGSMLERDVPSRERSLSSPDLAAAERLIARRRSALFREPDPRKRRAKVYALLARNGFDPDVCRTVAAVVDVGDDAGDAADE
jgi:hypothetical protein